MNAPRLTDAQVSQALRAHLPDRAQAGLRERILEAAETTDQQRPLPSFLGALSDADPVTRRRSVLIAAALLVALAIASAAAVGAMRLLQRDPVDDLSLEPPADVPAFVLSSYERLPQLPPLTFAWHAIGSDKGRVYVDRSGAVRFDRFTSVEATEPSSYTILSDHRISGLAIVGSDKVWVEPGHEAIGEDPRVFLRTILNAANAAAGPGCEMERDPSEVGNGTAATGWRHVGVEYVAGRPTHHVACVGDLSVDIDLWLDIETRLILRTREPETDDAGQLIPGQFGTTEVTEITFGEQPAALFEPPEGVARMPSEAYSEYLCTREVRTDVEVGFGVRDCATPEPEATPRPEATPLPAPTASVRPRPSGPAGPLAWSESRLDEDWPAPVRPEPAGGAILEPILVIRIPGDSESCCLVNEPGRYIDPTGDSGSDVAWLDISEVTVATYMLIINLASNQTPDVDPTELWYAYGIVFDDDRDGVPDRRFGLDNVRTWMTDLQTGRTQLSDGGSIGGEYLDTTSPRNLRGFARFSFGGDTPRGPSGMELDHRPFYVWASLIENGRIVATDYAPDFGWLDPSVKTKP